MEDARHNRFYLSLKAKMEIVTLKIMSGFNACGASIPVSSKTTLSKYRKRYLFNAGIGLNSIETLFVS
jgi:hypothetical protein